jgi:hypothetical protein
VLAKDWPGQCPAVYFLETVAPASFGLSNEMR